MPQGSREPGKNKPWGATDRKAFRRRDMGAVRETPAEVGSPRERDRPIPAVLLPFSAACGAGGKTRTQRHPGKEAAELLFWKE